MTWPRRLRAHLPVEDPSLYIVLIVSVLHLLWAGLLLWSPAAAHSTPVEAVVSVTHNRAGAVALLAGTGVLALIAAWLHERHRSLRPAYLALLLIPQQILLVVSAAGGITAALRGHYADGVARPWQFILGDQLPVILIALLYTTAILVIAARREQTIIVQVR